MSFTHIDVALPQEMRAYITAHIIPFLQTLLAEGDTRIMLGIAVTHGGHTEVHIGYENGEPEHASIEDTRDGVNMHQME